MREAAVALLILVLLVGGSLFTPFLSSITQLVNALRQVMNPDIVTVSVRSDIANTTEYKTVNEMITQLYNLQDMLLRIMSEPRAVAALIAAGFVYAVYTSTRQQTLYTPV